MSFRRVFVWLRRWGVSTGRVVCHMGRSRAHPGGDRGAGRAREGVLRTPSKNKKNPILILIHSNLFTKTELRYIITITYSQSNKRGDTMVKNNIEFDVKVKLLEENITQSDLADTLGTTRQQINRVVNKDSVVNKSFVDVMEALGYDIVLTYVPRE